MKRKRSGTSRTLSRRRRASRPRPPSGSTRRELLERLLSEGGEGVRSRLQALRQHLSEEAAAGAGDPEDQRARHVSRELELSLLQLDSRTLKAVDSALLRMEAGVYGRCDECTAQIPSARLKALPFAELCRICQERHEIDGTIRPLIEPNGRSSSGRRKH